MTKCLHICFNDKSKLECGIKPAADTGPEYLLSNLNSTSSPLNHSLAFLAFFIFLEQAKCVPPSRSFRTQLKSHLLSDTYLSTLTE